MLRNLEQPLPRMQILRIFESAARHSSFVRAADELGIHPPTVSRYIAKLEHDFKVQLFERRNRSVKLTPAGEEYYHGVTIGLERIAAAGLSGISIKENQRLIIACTHSTAHFVVMPILDSLRQALGENIDLSPLVIDFSLFNHIHSYDADIIITSDKTINLPEERVTLFNEAITPVCSPEFAATHANILARPVLEWGPLTFLRFSHPKYNWATWHDWFTSVGYPSPRPKFIGIADYFYLIESAIRGKGLALGWRGYIEGHLKEGRLIKVTDSFVECDRVYYAFATERGRQRTIVHQCIELLTTLKNQIEPNPSEVTVQED